VKSDNPEIEKATSHNRQTRPTEKLLQVTGLCLALSIRFYLEDYKSLKVLNNFHWCVKKENLSQEWRKQGNDG
jgi:hypothetical protein